MFRICVLVGFIALAGCNTAEGVRCNQLGFSDECADGLKCTVPDHCPGLIAYCCPADSPSSNASCNACTPPDGGGD